MLGYRFNKKESFIIISRPIKNNSGFRAVYSGKEGHYSVNRVWFAG